MEPKKAKTFIKSTSEQLNVPEELVELLAKEYWKEVRLTLTKGTEPIVYVKNLGTFMIKPTAIDKKIQLKERMLELMDKSIFKNFTKSKLLEESLENLRLLRDKFQETYQSKLQHKKKRDVYNLEKSKADPGGNLESDL